MGSSAFDDVRFQFPTVYSWLCSSIVTPSLQAPLPCLRSTINLNSQNSYEKQHPTLPTSCHLNLVWSQQPVNSSLQGILLCLMPRKVSYSRNIGLPVCQARHLGLSPAAVDIPEGNGTQEIGVWGNCHLSSLGEALA